MSHAITLPATPSQQQTSSTAKAARFLLISLFSCVVLFFVMTLRLNIYDEGIVLTDSMQVAAGQLPHRDFYAIYGPAESYLLAGLFKLFGKSILIERLLDLCIRSLTIATVYKIASQYLKSSIAVWITIASSLWLFGLLRSSAGVATMEVNLLNLISTSLLIPIFIQPISTRRMFLIGALAGVDLMFRYDTGFALFGIHALTVAAAIWSGGGRRKLSSFASSFWPYVAGFAVVALPPVLYFLSVSSIQPFLYDIVVFPSQYYARARSLPFPAIHLESLDKLSIYVPLVVIPLALFVSVRALASQRRIQHRSPSFQQDKKLNGLLLSFAILSVPMYLKGYIRISPLHLYMAIIPTLLLVGILFQQRSNFQLPLRLIIWASAFLSLLAPASLALTEARDLHENQLAVSYELFQAFQGKMPSFTKTWCETPSPATRGLCFIPAESDIQTAEFIDSHTGPNDRLYVGLRNHAKVFANDIALYFIADRLPATQWSEFDADLQNRADIQQQMIGELERAKPPYVVLDSEFESRGYYEPNDSSKSSGVVLLDNYIRNNYQLSRTFGNLTIWQRISRE